MQNLIIRADAGGILGTGHVMRMIALAQAYMRRGGEVTLASVQCPQPIIDRVQELGIKHVLFSDCQLGDENDARNSLQLCRDLESEWLVLDGYHFDEDYQKWVGAQDELKVLAVDDYGHCKTWHCDAVLNQNLGAEQWTKRQSSNPDTQWLLGSPFALIREEFLESIQSAKEKPFPLKNLLITLGGADPDNVTALVLEALEGVTSQELNLRVLIGGGNLHLDALKRLALDSKHKIEFLTNVRDMPSMYEWADGVISAGGSTCWEWLAYGLPGAVVTIADNQEPIVREIDSRKLACCLGWFTCYDEKKWRDSLHAWLNNKKQLANFKERREVIDANGADRVVALLSCSLKVTIATAKEGWLRHMIDDLQRSLEKLGCEVSIAYEVEDIESSDILFLLSFWSLVPNEVLRKNTHNLVIHGSNLPQGKGWSPVTWQILEGKNTIPMTLFEAVDQVDAGDIYLQNFMRFDGDELLDQIQEAQAKIQFKLSLQFVKDYPAIVTERKKQKGEASFYPKRSVKDSELDINKSIEDQFNLLRTVDNEAYPAFFTRNGIYYKITIEKIESPS